MSLLHKLPQELINILCVNIDYNEIIMLSEQHEINLEFDMLLLYSCSAFHKILLVCKNNDRYYRNNYTWETGFLLFESLNMYMVDLIWRSENLLLIKDPNNGRMEVRIKRYECLKEAYKYDDVDKFNNIFRPGYIDKTPVCGFSSDDFIDILSLYNLIIKKNDLDRYRILLPVLPLRNYFFASAIKNYKHDINDIILEYNITDGGDTAIIITFYKIFLYLLKEGDNISYPSAVIFELFSSKFKRTSKNRYPNICRFMFRYIIEYIERKEKLSFDNYYQTQHGKPYKKAI
jgi:hypothetical protein